MFQGYQNSFLQISIKEADLKAISSWNSSITINI